MAIGGKLLADSAPGNRRRAARRKLHLELSGEGEAANVTLLNLSLTGVLLRTVENLKSGERIRLYLPGGEDVAAKVVWSSEGLYGCRFERPISQAALSAALLKSRFDEPDSEPDIGPAPDRTTFGSRVKALRQARRLSLQALAEQVGVSKPALWKWERDEVRPRPRALARLSQALQVPPAELMFGHAEGDRHHPPEFRAILDTARAQVADLLGLEPEAVTVTVTIRDEAAA